MGVFLYVIYLDCVEALSVAVSCQGEFEPRGLAFPIPAGEVREGRSRRYMLNVLNFVVGTLVQARIGAESSRRKASGAAGSEFFLRHTFSPLKMEVHDLLPMFLEALVNLVADTPDGWSY